MTEGTQQTRVRVQTTAGPVVGERRAHLAIFRGIPYASPPSGELRFRPPRPVVPWTGDRDATTWAPMSLQPPPDPTGTVPGDPLDQSEDCLYLNVYTPVPDPQARMAVMVWIHGGAFVSGSATSQLYAGERLATEGEGVVLVSVNYRLGALGWLAHPSLAVEEAGPAFGGYGSGYGNWGLQDQIAALEWVRDNIEHFGGDPGNVTIFGESAGAMSVAALMATWAPGALFRRAILQSGAALALGQGSAMQIAEDLKTELGLSELTREALLALPAEDIVRAQTAIYPNYELLGLPFQPVIDGGVLTRHPAAAIAAGSASSVDVMVGTNRDEWRFWTWSNPALRDIDEGRLETLVRRLIEGAGLEDVLDPAKTVETYRSALETRQEAPVEPVDIYTALSSDWTFRVPAMRLAAGCGSRNVYAYLFDWESPFAGGALKSCHALDLPFVFGTCADPFVGIFSGSGEDAERLSEVMRRAWTSFARTGDPANRVSGEWPRYETERRATKRLGSAIEVLDAPMEVERAWLDDAFGPYGVLESENAARVRVPHEQ
jgi:para-nitrobenzyl esterase